MVITTCKLSLPVMLTLVALKTGGTSAGPGQASLAGPGAGDPVKRLADVESSGARLYSANCADCHGPSGRGDGPRAADMDPPPTDLTTPAIAKLDDRTLFRRISNGRRPMPSFARLLSQEDRWKLVNFIHSINPNWRPRS